MKVTVYNQQWILTTGWYQVIWVCIGGMGGVVAPGEKRLEAAPHDM